MRRFFASKLLMAAVLGMFTLGVALASEDDPPPTDGSDDTGIHGPTMPPNPWDGLTILSIVRILLPL